MWHLQSWPLSLRFRKDYIVHAFSSILLSLLSRRFIVVSAKSLRCMQPLGKRIVEPQNHVIVTETTRTDRRSVIIATTLLSFLDGRQHSVSYIWESFTSLASKLEGHDVVLVLVAVVTEAGK
jgi:hypothetical protein